MKLYIGSCYGSYSTEYGWDTGLSLTSVSEMENADVESYNNWANGSFWNDNIPNHCYHVRLCNLNEHGGNRNADLFVNAEDEETAEELFEDFLDNWNGNNDDEEYD